MRLVLIGDLHFYRLWVAPWRLFNKRVLALTNLWLNRRWNFDPALLATVIARAVALRPDMVLGSGDLSSTSLEAEFADAAAALRPLLDGRPALIVPGNHDRYTHAAARERVAEQSLPDVVPARLPVLRRLNAQWWLLALDSARPRLLTARGRIGAAQLAEARGLMQRLGPGQNLVVLCHYPPVVPPGAHDGSGHRLDDAAELCNLLRQFPGHVLFLHGHIHHPWCWPAAPAGLERVVMVNAGAPARKSTEYPRGQGFWEIELSDQPDTPARLWHHWPTACAAGGTQQAVRPSTGGQAASGTGADGWVVQPHLSGAPALDYQPHSAD